MSVELINRITRKKDGRVVISSHSSNDTAPYHAWECKSLTKIFVASGEAALDKEIVRMCMEYCQLRGSHPSVVRYRNIIDSADASRIRNEYGQIVDDVWNGLSKEDKDTRWNISKTDAMREFLEFENDYTNIMYGDIAKLINPGYSYPTAIYHYDCDGNEYWYDKKGTKRYTREEE